MNDKQKEIADLIVQIFSHLRLDVKYLYTIKEQFNVLSFDDHEWSEIEDHVFEIVKKIEKIHEKETNS